MSIRFDLEGPTEQPFYFETEEEARGRRRSVRPRRSTGGRGNRPQRPLTKPPVWGGFPAPWPVKPDKDKPKKRRNRIPFGNAPFGVPAQSPDCNCAGEGSERVRWLQVSLNNLFKLNLPVDGVVGSSTRAAVRSFQQREGLPVTGIVGPDTEQALMAAARKPTDLPGEPNQPEEEIPWLSSLFPGLAPIQIEDRTAFAPKENRKGKPRDMSKVYALVLHQTAFSRGNDTTKYDRIPVHFVITPNGRIIQLHPLSALLWSSNGFNAGSVAVEFVGNFPNTQGKCWEAKKFGCHRLTQEQIDAGRALVRHLIRTMGLTHVLAHRQSSGQRDNDPGPDVWYNVGQWAVDNLGLRDGGPGFKVGSGNSIPDLWRKWGQLRPQPELEFTGYEFERLGEMEGAERELSFGSPLRAPRKINPAFVSCNPPSAAIKAITGADPVATIQKANTRAIEMLDKVVKQLQDTRKKIIAGAAATAPTVPLVVEKALKDHFHLTASNRNIWTKQGSGTVDLIIRRFQGARQILADGWMKYTCLGPPTLALGNCTGNGGCPTDRPGRRAVSCGGHSRIVLCRAWWSDSLDEQAATLLHECLHIYFSFIRDSGNIANAHCYEHFVLKLNGIAVAAIFAPACP
jgi:hypothetical protein